MAILNNLEKYFNFKFIELSELKGKIIKDVFTNQYDNFLFIVTEDNEISGYKLEYFTDSIDEEFTTAQIYPLDFNDVMNFIMGNPYEYFFKTNNLVVDSKALYKELEIIEKQKEIEQKQVNKEQRYKQYLELKKEFDI